MIDPQAPLAAGDRLAKVIARAGLCSRRDAEIWIKEGRVTVNGRKVLTPAFNIAPGDKVKVDGEPLAARQGTRVWLYHKPAGLVVTEKDPEGRPTIFEALEETGLPRVVSIGRLDINTEGLLLLTNDGGLKRVLELPATGWLRRYRVRAFGAVTQAQLDSLKNGIEIEGIQYGPIEASLEREQGSNVWMVLGLREGKNREVKNVLGALGLKVNRLIRVSFGPFQLGELAEGAVEVVPARILRDQLGKRLAAEAHTDFESDMPEMVSQKKRAANPSLRAAAPGKTLSKVSPRSTHDNAFRFEDDETIAEAEARRAERPRIDRPGRGGKPTARPARPAPVREIRKVLYDDGTEGEIEVKPQRRAREESRWDPDESSARNFGRPRHHDEPVSADRGSKPPRGDRPDRPKKPFGDKPGRSFGDKPARSYGDKPARPYGDKPARPYGDKPARSYGDKPARSYGDKPARSYGDKPARSYGDKPARPYGDKPARPYGDKPARSYGDKPARPYGDKPARPYGDKPARPYGDRPDRPFKPRGEGAGPRPEGRGPRPEGRGPRPEGRGPRPEGRGPRPEGRGPSAEGRGPRPEGRGPRPEGRGPRPEGRGPRPEGRGPRPEGRGLRPEGRGPRPEGRGPRPGGGSGGARPPRARPPKS
jgi:23S rRNA pseudouridine2605 synthase